MTYVFISGQVFRVKNSLMDTINFSVRVKFSTFLSLKIKTFTFLSLGIHPGRNSFF